MKRRAIYPGTFDPITIGHYDIIERASKLFDEVIIGVAKSEEKKPLFSLEKRLMMVKSCIETLPNVSVKPFSSLLVDFAQQEKALAVIRGLRAVSDFEYELQMAYTNRSLWDGLETICLMPSLEHAFISSTVVRSILHFHGDVSHLVHPRVVTLLHD